MAIVSCRETWISGRDASIDEKVQKQYRRFFRVITSDPLDGPGLATAAIFFGFGITLYVPYVTPTEADYGAFVKKMHPRQDADNPCAWTVEVEYGTFVGNPRDDDPSQAIEDPQARPPNLSWDKIKYRRILSEEPEGGFYVNNSAGQPFDPPYEVDATRLVLRYERNELTYDAIRAADYMDSVNRDTWLGFPAGRALCHSITAVRQFERLVFYWRVSYEFHFDMEYGFSPVKLLDAGMYEKDPTGSNLVPVYDRRTMTPISAPVPLDGAGRALPAGGTPVFRSFRAYKRRSFAALGIV